MMKATTLHVSVPLPTLLWRVWKNSTIIGFKDGGTGIVRELQCVATRSQNSHSERNLLSTFRDISSWCDQFSLPKTISDISK
jgi:transcription initiation factor TFIIB